MREKITERKEIDKEKRGGHALVTTTDRRKSPQLPPLLLAVAFGCHFYHHRRLLGREREMDQETRVREESENRRKGMIETSYLKNGVESEY